MNLLETLRGRSSVGLDAIESVALMDRFDAKYLVPQAWLVHLVTSLSDHRVLSIQDHVTTTYKNLYYDTKDGKCFEDHTRGRNVRFKVRIRHYDNTGVTFLEVKLRDVHGKTTKHRVVRDSKLSWNAPFTGEELNFLARHVPHSSDLEPTLQSQFERFTLVNVTLGERITFDHQLNFCHPSNDEKSESWLDPMPNLAVVEWKQHRLNHQGELMQAMRNQEGRKGPLGRPLRLSKFVLGHSLVYPEKAFRSYQSALRAVTRAEHYAANPTFAHQSLLR